MQRIAIIDIGSNSARLVISHIYKSGAATTWSSIRKKCCGLPRKQKAKGCFPKKRSTARCRSCSLFGYMCRQYKTDKIIAVATAAIRNAKTGSQLTNEVFRKDRNPASYYFRKTWKRSSVIWALSTPCRRKTVSSLTGRRLHRTDSVPEPETGGVRFHPAGSRKHNGHFPYPGDTMPPSAYSDINFFISPT